MKQILLPFTAYFKVMLRSIFLKYPFQKWIIKRIPYKHYQHNFHSSARCGGKLFQEVENEYAHNILENRQAYSLTVIRHPSENGQISPFLRDNASLNTNTIFDEFFNVSISANRDNLKFEDPKFSNLLKNVSYAISNANDDQIINVLHCMCLWLPAENTRMFNFKLLWNTVDNECAKRLRNWTIDRKLVVADYWFHLRLNRITEYNSRLIVDLVHNIDRLSNHDIVQLMFYVNLQRNISQELLSHLVSRIKFLINDIDIEELSIICLAFFKTKSKIFSSLVVLSIIQRLNQEVPKIKSITAAAILKFLRKSLRTELTEDYIILMQSCIPFIKNWDIPTSVHLALLSSETNVYHPVLLDIVTEKLTASVKSIRLKDGLKLLQSVSRFNHMPSSKFNDALFKEIGKASRQIEINSRPRDLVFIFLFYAYMNHYDYKMLTKVMDEKFVDLCIAKDGLDMSHGHVDLDYCVEIDCPDYEGPRLKKSMQKIANGRRGNFPNLTHNFATKLLNDVMNSLIELQGSDHNILVRHVLPHFFSPDIILRLFPHRDSKPLSELYQDYAEESILSPPKEEIWACFVISGQFSFAYKSKHIAGLTAMKLRQLEKLGYKVIFLSFHDVSENEAQRKNFIKRKLECLENDLKSKSCMKV